RFVVTAKAFVEVVKNTGLAQQIILLAPHDALAFDDLGVFGERGFRGDVEVFGNAVNVTFVDFHPGVHRAADADAVEAIECLSHACFLIRCDLDAQATNAVTVSSGHTITDSTCLRSQKKRGVPIAVLAWRFTDAVMYRVSRVAEFLTNRSHYEKGN